MDKPARTAAVAIRGAHLVETWHQDSQFGRVIGGGYDHSEDSVPLATERGALFNSKSFLAPDC
jgi:hypothetical protein